MALSCVIKVFAYVMVVCVLTRAAPIGDKGEASLTNSDNSKTQHEDQDLHELLDLVDTEAHQDNVVVRQEHTAHVTNNNGKTTKVEQKEEKVVDANSGDVIADVKQETEQQEASQGEEPETVVKTEVQLPADGVDETYVQKSSDETGEEFSNGEENDEVEEEADENMEALTAEDMAEFLLATQQVDAFFPALQRLVNQSKMTPAEAQAYASRVMEDIDQIQMEELAARAMEEKRDYMPYLAESPVSANDVMDTEFLPVAQEPVYMSPEDSYKAQQLLQQQAIPDFLREDPIKFLFSLYDAAYEKGDPAAQEVINILYDRVSQSADPSDLHLIRNLEKHYNDLYRPMETYVEIPEDLWTNQEAGYARGLIPMTDEDGEVPADVMEGVKSNQEEAGDIEEKEKDTFPEVAETQEAAEEDKETEEQAKVGAEEEIEDELESVLSNENTSSEEDTQQQMKV